MFGFKMGIESLRIVRAVNCFDSFAASVYKIFLMYIMPFQETKQNLELYILKIVNFYKMDCNPLVDVSIAYRNLLGTD